MPSFFELVSLVGAVQATHKLETERFVELERRLRLTAGQLDQLLADGANAGLLARDENGLPTLTEAGEYLASLFVAGLEEVDRKRRIRPKDPLGYLPTKWYPETS